MTSLLNPPAQQAIAVAPRVAKIGTRGLIPCEDPSPLKRAAEAGASAARFTGGSCLSLSPVSPQGLNAVVR